MYKIENLVGREFGNLKVLRYVGQSKDYINLWECQCSCDEKTILIVPKNRLMNGQKSCGCLRKKALSEKRSKHKMSNSRIYKTWINIKRRCLNTNFAQYLNYGGRGITICGEWLDKENGFMNFYNWAMENGYNDKLSIDRINVNGNYEPSNCRWTTNEVQQNNKTNNINITIDGKTKNMQQWCEELNINRGTFNSRYINNSDINNLLKPIRPRIKYITIENITKSVREWCSEYDINISTFRGRLRKGLTGVDLLKSVDKIKTYMEDEL